MTVPVPSNRCPAIAALCKMPTAWKFRVSEPRLQANVNTFVFGLDGGGSAIAGTLASSAMATTAEKTPLRTNLISPSYPIRDFVSRAIWVAYGRTTRLSMIVKIPLPTGASR